MATKKKQIPKELRALSKAMRILREKSGLSQDDLAEKADLDRTYISGIERGLRNPTYLVMLRISRAMGVNLLKLIEEIER